MCDSDEDEFLSASEGELDDIEEKPKEETTEMEEENAEDDKIPDSKVTLSEDSAAEADDHDADKCSTKSSLCSSGSASDSDKSLSKDKKELLEAIVKETVASLESEERDSTPSQAPNQKSINEGWGEDAVLDKSSVGDAETDVVTSDAASPPAPSKEQDSSATLYHSLVPDTSEPEPEDASKKASNVSATKEDWDKIKDLEDGSAWDDWGEDNKESKDPVPVSESAKPQKDTEDVKASIDGWDDWSLVDDRIPKERSSEANTPKCSSSTTPASATSKKPADKDDGGWGWGGLVSAVGETFTSTIESSLGFPSPEEMVRRNAMERKSEDAVDRSEPQQSEKKSDSASTSDGISRSLDQLSVSQSRFGMLSGLVTGGIDVLESIGKKTFEAVTVTDSKGTGRRRMMFSQEDGQNLSDVLKELRQRQDTENTIGMGGVGPKKSAPDVASSFERSEGMVHLEALEMLSSSRGSPSATFSRQFLGELDAVDTENADSDGFERDLVMTIKKTGLQYEPKTLLECDVEIDTRLSWCDGKTEDELFEDAIRSLVEFTASSVQVVSKLSNLLLIMGSGTDWHHFIALFSLLSRRLNSIAARYTEVINAAGFGSSKADDLSTQVLVESATALDFIRQAHRLMAPMFNN